MFNLQLDMNPIQGCSPLQKTRFVVSTGNECRKLNLICVPNFEKVPVPVLSSLKAPFSMTSSTMSKYCTIFSEFQSIFLYHVIAQMSVSC